MRDDGWAVEGGSDFTMRGCTVDGQPVGDPSAKQARRDAAALFLDMAYHPMIGSSDTRGTQAEALARYADMVEADRGGS